MDRLTSLTVFTRVVDSGGFSAAAKRLNMSPTMVSNHVQALEDHLGVRLLNRTTRKIGLTDVGREYYERCTQILSELAEADQIAGALQLTPRGLLRLHCETHLARFIGPLVAAFLAANPEVAIDVRIGERMPDLIEDGFDLAIRATPAPDSSLIARRLAAWRPMLCGAPSYLAVHPAPVSLTDLSRHNCLRYAPYPYGDEWRFTAPDGRTAAVRVAGNLIGTSGEIIRAVALAGGGLILAPSFLIGEDVQGGALVPLLSEYRPVEFAITAFYPHRRYLAAKVRSFVDALAGHFVEHQRWLEPGNAQG